MDKTNVLSNLDELRNDEGLARIVHKSLEDIVRNITRDENPCITLAECNVDVE